MWWRTERQPVDVLVVGSSVAAGSAAQDGRGWVALLAVALLQQHNLALVNEAVGGCDTNGVVPGSRVL